MFSADGKHLLKQNCYQLRQKIGLKASVVNTFEIIVSELFKRRN